MARTKEVKALQPRRAAETTVSGPASLGPTVAPAILQAITQQQQALAKLLEKIQEDERVLAELQHRRSLGL